MEGIIEQLFKFLKPVIKKDIRKYFQYDFDDGLINPSNKDKEKAQYMIDTLHLNEVVSLNLVDYND